VPKDKRDETNAIRVTARLMQAMSHPMRIRIMAELNKPEHTISPSKFAALHDIDLSKVSYHFTELKKFNATIGLGAYESPPPS